MRATAHFLLGLELYRLRPDSTARPRLTNFRAADFLPLTAGGGGGGNGGVGGATIPFSPPQKSPLHGRGGGLFRLIQYSRESPFLNCAPVTRTLTLTTACWSLGIRHLVADADPPPRVASAPAAGGVVYAADDERAD